MAHGFTVQGGLGAGGSVILHESSDHSVLVPDAELLFTAQFHRAGPDLVLTGRDGAHHLVPGYFSSEHHPALVAPNGAHLSADTVDLLAGSATPGHYAQAQPTAPADSIGKIEKVVGDVTVVRNGVSVALHVGDAVFKSDVVATGSSSSCGISFPDGTALNLVANTRMALNDYAFDANSNSNGALFTLVEGTFAFVAGKVAHQGDMKIATPVATMGIRGTTGVVQEQPNAPATITATAADHTYSFAVVPDIGTGVTGMWDVYLTDANGVIQRDANGNPIVLVTVSQAGFVTYVTPQGVGQQPLVTTEPVTNSQYAFEQEMLSDLFRTLNPANLNNNNSGGSSTTPPPFELPNPIPQLFEDSGKPFNINLSGSSTSSISVTINDTVGSSGPLTIVIWVTANSGPWSAGPNWLGGAPPTSPQEVEILNPVKVTTDGADSAAGLVINPGATLNIVSGTSFTIYDFIQGGGTIQLNGTGSDPTLFIHGAVSLVGGGTIKMLGPVGEDNILGVPGTGAMLLNIDYTIEGTGTIGGGDGNLTFQNFGTVNANNDVLTINTGNQVYNDGLMEATAGDTLRIEDSVVNAGTVQAEADIPGFISLVKLSGTTFDNLFAVTAKNGGFVFFEGVTVTNEAGATINATQGGSIELLNGALSNAGMLEATAGGAVNLLNIVVTNIGAGEISIETHSELGLDNATVRGGIIDNAGTVFATGSSILDGHTVTNSGAIYVTFIGGALTLEGDTLTNTSTGTIEATGSGASIDIEINNANTTNDGLIEALNGGTVTIDVNENGSRNNNTIEADGGTVIINSNGGGGGGDSGGNYGTIEAIDGGTVTINGGITNRADATIKAVGTGSTVDFSERETQNLGTIKADGAGAEVDFTKGMLDNSHLIVAENGGAMSLATVMITNEIDATVEATSGGSISWITGGIDNLGTFDADGGSITFGGSIGVTNEGGGIFEASNGGSITFATSGIGSVSNDGGGLIEALSGGTITFDSTLNGAQNIDGIIEAAANGTVTIDGFAFGAGLFNIGGYIEADGSKALVQLAGATIIGGTLEDSGGGLIETKTGSGTSTLMNVTIANGSIIEASTGTILDLQGGSGGLSNPAVVIDGTVTFDGGGAVKMDFPSYFIVAGTGDGTLDNQTTIEGQGTIGTGDTPLPGVLTLVNSGTIEAVGGEFDINTGTRNSATTTNTGTLEANGANAVLLIHHTIMNDAGGTIAAINGADAISATASVVELLDDVIVGGTLKASNFGTIETITDHGAASTTVFDGVTNQGYVLVNDNTTLLLRNTIDNTGGKIALALSGQSDLQIDGTVTLKSGEVELDTSLDKITALATGATLDNTANIHGQGEIGAGDDKLTFDNLAGGIVNATGFLIINTGNNIVENSGLLEAIVNGGVLTIESAVDNAGTIKADGGGASVTLSAGVANYGMIEAITGGIVGVEAYSGTIDNYGTMKADGGQLQLYDQVQNTSVTNHAGGVIEALDHGMVSIAVVGGMSNLAGGLIEADGGSITFDVPGVLTNAANATIEALDGGILSFTAATTTFDNAGTVSLDDGTLALEFDLTLEGGGKVTLSDDKRNVIDSFGAAETLANVDNTISGAGTIGDARLTLVNEQHGVIDADGVNALILDTGANTITNAGLLEATNGATLEIKSGVANDGGTITASGAGSVVELFGVTVTGGTLESSGNGVIETATASGTSTLSGVTMNGGSILEASDGTFIDLEDTTTINGTVTFEGGGTFMLDDPPQAASIVGGASGGTLDIAVGATLTGSGDIGNAGATSLTLNNAGTIDADGDGAAIDIDTGNSVTNTGTLEAANCGTLQIDDAVNNAGGTIKALHGGTITFDGGALDDESATDGVAGGVVEATARGATITFDNIAVTLDSAVAGGGGTIKASSGGAIVFNCGTINSAASTPVSGGLIEALTCGTIRFNGTNIYNQGSSIDADGVGAMIMLAGAMILGGTLETSAHGVIETVACTGNSTLDGVTIATGSTIQVDDHTTLTLQDTVDDNPTITNNGTITLVQGCDPSLIVNGDITLAGSGTVVLSGDTDSIVGAGKGAEDTLHNANTIAGAGTIGGEGLVLSNLAGGVVDADASGHTLVLDTGTTVTNLGTLEATHGGILEIDDNVCNIGGTIAAYGCGSVVELEGVTIKGGMFLTDDSTLGDRGVIEVVSTDNATVFDGGSGHAISIAGFVQVDAGATLKLIGTIDLAAYGYNGTIDLAQISTDSGDSGADLVICGTVTLTGSGGITMHGDADEITAAAPGAALHNAASISGAGSIGIGNDWLHLVNETAGVINADNASADSLTVDIGCNTIHNHGFMEATGGGTLVLNSDVENSCGTIQAVGCDSTVNIDQITVSHGTLQTSCDGLIQVVCGESTFCDVHVNGGNLTVEGDATLKLSGVTVDGTNIDDYTDSGSTVVPGTIEITGDSAINHSTVDGKGGPADNGSPGVITVDCHTTLTLDSTTLEDLNLTNNGALHVAGSSEVTLDSVGVTNNGCINVDLAESGAILTLDDDTTITRGKLTISAQGALDIATGNDGSGHGATLDGVTVTNNSGNIDVDVTDSGAVLTLDDDTTITGGNLTTGTYGALHVATGADGAGHGATLDGVNVIDNGDINLDSGAILTLDDGTKITGTATGTLTIAAGDTVDVEHGSSELSHGAVFDGLTVNDNGGALDIGDVNSGAILTLEDATTITGGGTGTMTIHANNTVDVEKGSGDGPNVTGATLDGVHVTDCGALDVGDAPLASGAILTLDDGTTVTGGGTGQLTINFGNTLAVEKGTSDCHNGATLDGVIVQDNGTIDIGHAATGAIFTITGGTTINGGATAALTINFGSTLDVANGPHGGGATLDDVHITDNGAFDIGDVASGAILTLQDDATITGGGIGTMTIHANNTVDVETSTNGGATLDGVQVTDNGAFDIGDLLLSDSGAILILDDGTTVNGCGTMTINAGNTLNVTGGTTTIDLGGTITNNGTIEASGGGTLDIASHVDNGSGALLATSGGVLDIESAICGGTATIHAATLEFGAASNVNVTFDNGDGGTDYGLLILKDPEHFSGTISGFHGACPDAADSDEVELAGFVKTSCSIQDCGDNQILTLTDANGDVVTLKFVNFDDTLIVKTDGDNTYIYDPPAGAKDAPATVTAAPSNEHTAAPAHQQNGTDHAAGPANEAGFGGDQSSVVTSNMTNSGDAAPLTNELAPAHGALALGSGLPAGTMSDAAFGGNSAPASSAAGEVDAGAGALTDGLHGGLAQSLLSSLLNVLTGGEQDAGAIQVSDSIAPVLDKHLTDWTIVDGSDAAHSHSHGEFATPPIPPAPANEHVAAPATVTAPPPATSPTPASASLGGMGNDNFAFHPNLGSDTAQNTDAHTSELAHNNVQISGPALASTAPEWDPLESTCRHASLSIL